MAQVETEAPFTFDPNYEFDVNDERYWAAVLAAIDQIRSETSCPTTTTATTLSPKELST